MRLLPYQPFSNFDEFHQPMDQLHPMIKGGIIPPVDMYEKGQDLIVETPLAGIDAETIDVSVEGGVLTIKGSTERKTEVDEKDYYRKEVRSGSVYRSIPLPVQVLEGKAKARYENGMLRIELPKLTGGEGKKTIKINVNKENE